MENKRDLKSDLKIARAIPSEFLDQTETNVLIKYAGKNRAWEHAIVRAMVAEKALILLCAVYKEEGLTNHIDAEKIYEGFTSIALVELAKEGIQID